MWLIIVLSIALGFAVLGWIVLEWIKRILQKEADPYSWDNEPVDHPYFDEDDEPKLIP